MRLPVGFPIALGLLLCLLPRPVLAIKNIIIDWEQGELTETVDPVEEKVEEPKAEVVAGDEERVERLRRAAKLQQQVIRRQQTLIEELRQENRRLERMLLGYDQLLQRCR